MAQPEAGRSGAGGRRDERELRAVAEEVRRHLEPLPEVVAAFLHGSFLEHHASRDIDVAVLLDGPPADAARYTLDLATDLAIALRRPVSTSATTWWPGGAGGAPGITPTARRCWRNSPGAVPRRRRPVPERGDLSPAALE